MVPLILTCTCARLDELLDDELLESELLESELLEDELLDRELLLLENELLLDEELLLEEELLDDELLLEDELLTELLVTADEEDLGALDTLLEPPSEPPPQATNPKLRKTAAENGSICRTIQVKPLINASNFLGV